MNIMNDTSRNLNVPYDMDTIKRKMLVKYPFFGSVVANVDYIENNQISTAGTNGKTIYYNRMFLENLSVDEQTFIFAHEVCHIAFNHILRSEGKNPTIWNIATDAVINAFLKKDGLKMVEGGVDMVEAINYDAEQLYEKLLKEKQEQDKNEKGNNTQSQSSNGQNGNHSGGNSTSDTKIQNKDDNQSSGNGEQNKNENKQDVGHDTHSMWEDAVREHKEKQSKNKGKESLFDKLFNKDKKEKKEEKNDIEKKQQETEQLGEKEVFKKNKEEKIKQLQELKKSLSEQAMGPGSSTNRDRRNITDIGRAKP